MVAGAICGSAQIVTDIGVGSDDWLGFFTAELRLESDSARYREHECSDTRRLP